MPRMRIRRSGSFVCAFSIGVGLAAAIPRRSAQGPQPYTQLERASLDWLDGEIYTCQGANCKNNSHPALDAQGRRVVWDTEGREVVPGVPNAGSIPQVYVRDLVLGTTTLLSRNDLLGVPAGNAESHFAAISADGSTAAFSSKATNLDPDDVSPLADVYVCDVDLKTIERLTELPGGGGFNGVSGGVCLSQSGRFVGFTSNATNVAPLVPLCVPAPAIPSKDDVFVADRVRGVFEWVSVADGCSAPDGVSWDPSMDYDGTLVAFTSHAANLLTTPDPNGATADIFLRDLATKTTIPISVDHAGALAGSGDSVRAMVAGEGGFVVFQSAAENFVLGDNNLHEDIFVRDLAQEITVRVSVSSFGAQGDGPSVYPAISADGRIVAFSSTATNLVPWVSRKRLPLQFFVHDRDVSGNGVFDEPGDIATWRVSADALGEPANAQCGFAGSMSYDGSRIAFLSEGSNLVPYDRNGIAPLLCTPACRFGRDIFLVTR